MLGKFVKDSYAGEWYNGKREETTEYIGNKISMLVGMPRLRQLRIREGKRHQFSTFKFKNSENWCFRYLALFFLLGTCQVVKEFKGLISECYDYYSSSEEDTTRLYLPQWVHLLNSQLKWTNLSDVCPRPWRYLSAQELNNYPSWAQHHPYDGGGYVLDLGYDRPTAMRMMEDVKDKNWIDRRTRAVLLEFQVMNLNSNLISIVTYYYEVLPFGFGQTWEQIDTIKIFNLQSLSFGFYLTCQVLFFSFSIDVYNNYFNEVIF